MLIFDCHALIACSKKSTNFSNVIVNFQSSVWICMELMETCFDKLKRKTEKPIPENVIGKLTVSVSTKILVLFFLQLKTA